MPSGVQASGGPCTYSGGSVEVSNGCFVVLVQVLEGSHGAHGLWAELLR